VQTAITLRQKGNIVKGIKIIVLDVLSSAQPALRLGSNGELL
jgi:hypothetical protein